MHPVALLQVPTEQRSQMRISRQFQYKPAHGGDPCVPKLQSKQSLCQGLYSCYSCFNLESGRLDLVEFNFIFNFAYKT